MDERTYCLTPEQWRHAKACLTLAKRWGLIGDDSPEALERRRAAKNAQAERAEQDGKPVYGTRRFSAPAYLQYELTRFKLDFAEPCEKIRALGICPDFTDAQTRAWYDANPDLFTRYAGDSFPYEEVKQIIEKLGGFITVRSRKGTGSLFQVALPSHFKNADVNLPNANCWV